MRLRIGITCLVLAGVMSAQVAQCAGPDPAALKESIQRGISYLRVSQAENGSWTTEKNCGITGLCTYALLRSGVSPDDPTVAKALKNIEGYIQKDGGLYAADSTHRNYETSIALLALQAANADGRYKETIDHAVKFLKGLQWDDEEKTPQSEPAYGGQGYGSHQRPDLSNTAFFIQALREAGAPEDDPAIQKALVFVSRCQNLESSYNTTEFAKTVNDGGFYYTPAAGGNSQAGTTPEGGLRSYGSMTYAGLKSMLYAGVGPDDPRVKAATDWASKFYTIEENPGMGQQGLFYYYHTISKALSIMGQDQFTEASGAKHDWRKELAEHLFAIQQPNGSWVNPEKRWYESDPNLVTGYSLLTLDYCQPSTQEK